MVPCRNGQLVRQREGCERLEVRRSGYFKATWKILREKTALRIPVAWLQEKNARTRNWCTLVQSRTYISSSLSECSIPNQKDPYPFKGLQDKWQINNPVGHHWVQRTPTLLSLTFASALNKLLLGSLCSSASECVFIFPLHFGVPHPNPFGWAEQEPGLLTKFFQKVSLI